MWSPEDDLAMPGRDSCTPVAPAPGEAADPDRLFSCAPRSASGMPRLAAVCNHHGLWVRCGWIEPATNQELDQELDQKLA
jgi:hypothetical protein